MLSFSEKTVYTTPTKLPEEMLNSMVTYVEEREYFPAKTHRGAELEDGIKDNRRSSSVSWINWDEWIPGILYNMIYSANKEYFKYDITHFNSKIQSTIYTSENRDHYTWHVDNSTPSLNTDKQEERKLSISLILSGPDEYEGGELQFAYYKGFNASVRPQRGTAIIFPGWMPHRVRPVTKGKRISLVGWVDGPMFK